MIVYRLEKNGRGPYGLITHCPDSCGGLYELITEMQRAHDNSDYPTPYEDGIDPILLREYYCGFNSLEKLHQWFRGFLERLQSYGFCINKYESDDVCLSASGKQLVFRLKEARRLYDESITTPSMPVL